MPNDGQRTIYHARPFRTSLHTQSPNAHARPLPPPPRACIYADRPSANSANALCWLRAPDGGRHSRGPRPPARGRRHPLNADWSCGAWPRHKLRKQHRHLSRRQPKSLRANSPLETTPRPPMPLWSEKLLHQDRPKAQQQDSPSTMPANTTGRDVAFPAGSCMKLSGKPTSPVDCPTKAAETLSAPDRARYASTSGEAHTTKAVGSGAMWRRCAHHFLHYESAPQGAQSHLHCGVAMSDRVCLRRMHRIPPARSPVLFEHQFEPALVDIALLRPGLDRHAAREFREHRLRIVRQQAVHKRERRPLANTTMGERNGTSAMWQPTAHTNTTYTRRRRARTLKSLASTMKNCPP